MSSSDPIRRLRAVAAAAGLVDPELGRWLSAAIEAAEAGEKLEAALGLAGNWRHLERCARRDEAIRKIHAEQFPNVSIRFFAATLPDRSELLAQIPGAESVTREVIRRAFRWRVCPPTTNAPRKLKSSPPWHRQQQSQRR